MVLNVVAGKRPRDFHIGTADWLARPVNSATALGPPSSEITSSMVESRFVMPQVNITPCDTVKRHIWEFASSQFVYKIGTMAGESKYPFEDQGRRLRWLRQAMRMDTASAFAKFMNWPQSGMSQFETGMRRVPMDKALQLRSRILGFDPLWLWEGDKRGLSFDLLQRIEAEEAKEPSDPSSEEEPDEGARVKSGRER